MRRRFIRKILAGISVFSIALVSSGCGSQKAKAPDATMNAFYQLMICQNSTEIAKLGIDENDAQKTKDTYHDSMISTLRDEFSKAGVSITESEATDIFNAISQKLSILKYKVEVKNEDGKEATVKVSSQYINYLDLFKQAAQNTTQALKPNHIEKISDAKKLLVDNIITDFQNVQASQGMHSKTFELKEQKVKSGKKTLHIYFPKDTKQTGSDLMKLVTNQ